MHVLTIELHANIGRSGPGGSLTLAEVSVNLIYATACNYFLAKFAPEPIAETGTNRSTMVISIILYTST